MTRRFFYCFMCALWIASAGQAAEAANDALQNQADRLLKLVNATYQSLYRIENEAQWLAATDVSAAHDAAAETAGKARAAFVGNPALIEEIRLLLSKQNELNPLTVRQLKRALLIAAEGPMTNPQLAADRIAAETHQASIMNSFPFELHGKPITANEIDRILQNSTNLTERLEVWEASKKSGPALKPGLVALQGLRNGVAKELGYSDYFSLQSASYDLTTAEVIQYQDNFMRDLKPLYLQLHTWTKHELARKFGQPVPKRIPAHWINNRWSQNWVGIVEAANIDDRFAGKSPEWIVKTAENFYSGLGLGRLPESFWKLSDLYPVPAGNPRKKNTHASCWHVDLGSDIRSLMSVEPNSQWFETTHHELGHAYYFMSYTRPEVPPLLRTSANPSFHEGIAELISLATGLPAYLKQAGVLPANHPVDQDLFLLNDALANSIPFIYWSSGTMTHWEADLYSSNLAPDQWNKRWWQYVRDMQGVEPPSERSEEFCDAATKTHINDNPAYYFAYAFATVIKFQLHDYIARNILKQPPQNCNYANHPEVGDFLRKIMQKGAAEDWRKVMRDATGEDLSTRAMMEYFKPLMKWLQEKNAGRTIGWD